MMNQRSQFRIPVSRRGFVKRGTKTSLCEVLDLTENGLRINTDLPLALDETVGIECQLDTETIIQCELLVTHAAPPEFGGRMTRLLPEHQRQLAQFIEHLIAASMGGV